MPNISRSKGNQTMKFGQLIWSIEHDKCFSQNSYSKSGGEISLRLFSKNKIMISHFRLVLRNTYVK